MLGATAEDPPPGIEAAADAVADSGTRPTARRCREPCADADGHLLLAARRAPSGSDGACPPRRRLRWIQSASDGVDRVLFPELVERRDRGDQRARDLRRRDRGVGDRRDARLRVAVLHQRDAQLADELGATARPNGWRGTRLLVVGPGADRARRGRRAESLGVQVGAAGRTARVDDLFGTVVATSDLAAFDAALGSADRRRGRLPLTDATTRPVRRGPASRRCGRRRASKRGSRRHRGRGGARRRARTSGAIARRGPRRVRGGAAAPREPVVVDAAGPGRPRTCAATSRGGRRRSSRSSSTTRGRFARGEELRNPVDTRAGHGAG